MTAQTIDAALAIEAQRGDEYRAQLRAEGFRAGAEAMREAAAKRLGDLGWRESATEVRSLPLPESDHDR